MKIARGIEVGNIFQLGTKYTKTMGMEYLDQDGKKHNPIMGCYGIGVGRLAASVCEVRRDDYGPIWPITIAPWEVQLCCMRADDAECKEFADKLYDDLQKAPFGSALTMTVMCVPVRCSQVPICSVCRFV